MYHLCAMIDLQRIVIRAEHIYHADKEIWICSSAVAKAGETWFTLRITVAVADPLNHIAGAGALLPNCRIRALLGKA